LRATEDDGAATADLRCFDKTCPQQRHRNIGEIEIEQNARGHEERTGQKFANVPVSPGEIEAPDSHDDSCNYVEGNDHAFLLSSPFRRIWADGMPTPLDLIDEHCVSKRIGTTATLLRNYGKYQALAIPSSIFHPLRRSRLLWLSNGQRYAN
jgi:hypothetical protein